MNTPNNPSRKFFVVDGPVQPDQPSYVVREADHQLHARLRDGEYCHVLAPPQTGKTSLMAHATRRLQAVGVRVATLDLVDIGSRHAAEDPARWYYSFAYRIVRELRIRADMNSWWQERVGLTIMQRLRDFFLEMVLVEVRQPVVIFIDRLEAIADQRAVWEILDAIRACFDARVTVPEYQRLTFVLLGEIGPVRALPADKNSPFAVSSAIELSDFTPEQLRELCRGLGYSAEDTAALADRLWHWTSGHPYLAQKTLRALARQRAAAPVAAAVDKAVARLFLGRNATREEPHLSIVTERIMERRPRRVARLSAYGRVRKGLAVSTDRNRREHRDLLDAGIVVDADGRLAVRNRIYAEAFTAHWANRNLPFGWAGPAAAAAVLAIVVTAPVWYAKWLPAPYARILTGATKDFVAAQDAWQRLRRFPGLTTTADNLFLEYLTRQSQRAVRLSEVQRIGERIQPLPGGEERAAELLTQFWDRRANLAAQRGDRDAALMYRLKSLDRPDREREQRLAELLGEDLKHLIATIRPPATIRAIELDTGARLLTALDENGEISVWRLGETAAQRVQRLTLSAEEIQPLQRRVVHQRGRFARRLGLVIRLEHPRPTDVEIVLQAPSGQRAVLRAEESQRVVRAGELRFDSSRNRTLLPLLEHSVTGTWTAWIADTRIGAAGRLVGWELELDGTAALPPPEAAAAPAAIPEPRLTHQIGSALGPGGRRALSWPSDPASRGDLLVWDVASGAVTARLARPAHSAGARFVLGHSAVLIAGERELELRESAAGKPIGRIALGPGAEPLISDTGRYLVMRTVTRDGAGALVVWDLKDLRQLGQFLTGIEADAIAIDSSGRILAVGDGERFVRLWSVRDQALVAECQHDAPPRSIRFDARGRWMAVEDASHRLQIWSIGPGCTLALARPGSGAWLVGFAPDRDIAVAGDYGRGFSVWSLPDGDRLGPALQPGMGGAGAAPGVPTARPLLDPALGLVLTYDGRKALKLWRPLLSAETPEAVTLPGHTLWTEDIAISPDGQLAALGTRSGDVRVTPLGQGLTVGDAADPAFIGHLSAVTRVAFSSDGKLVASGSLEGVVRIWDSESGAPRAFFAAHLDGPVRDLVFLPGNVHVVAASRRTVAVTDVTTGATAGSLQIQAEDPRLEAGRDGESIFIAGDRDGITRWDWRSGTRLELGEAGLGVRRIAVSPKGDFLATAGEDRVVRVWRPETGAAMRRTVTAGAPVDGLWFIDEHRVLVQAGAWLHALEVTSSGLDAISSRMLPDGGTLVRPMVGGRELLLVSNPFSAVPAVQRVPMQESWAAQSETAPAELQAELTSRLHLAINEMGEARPLESNLD